MVRRSLAEGLGLPHDPAAFVVFRDARTGLEFIRSCREIWERGLDVALDAYGTHVFWEFREVVDGAAGQWGRLARAARRGPASRRSTMRSAGCSSTPSMRRCARSSPTASSLPSSTARPAATSSMSWSGGSRRSSRRSPPRPASMGTPRAIAAEVRARAELALVRVPMVAGDGSAATGASEGPEAPVASGTSEAAVRAEGATGDETEPATDDDPAAPDPDRQDRATLLAWLALSRAGALAPGADVAATSLAWYDDLRLPHPLVSGLHGTGFDEGAAWAIADQVRVLLALPRPSSIGGPGRSLAARLLDAWLANDAVRVAIGVNRWEGVDYLDRDRFAATLRWAVRLDAIEAGAGGPADDAVALVSRMTAAADAAGYRVDRLRTDLASVPKTDRPRRRTPRPSS